MPDGKATGSAWIVPSAALLCAQQSSTDTVV